jgi:hypothetical protein
MGRKCHADRATNRGQGHAGEPCRARRHEAPPVLGQAATLKVGLPTVKSGPLAQGGIQMEQGIATFLKEKSKSAAPRGRAGRHVPA